MPWLNAPQRKSYSTGFALDGWLVTLRPHQAQASPRDRSSVKSDVVGGPKTIDCATRFASRRSCPPASCGRPERRSLHRASLFGSGFLAARLPPHGERGHSPTQFALVAGPTSRPPPGTNIG
jgi:hypothetical protein